MKSEEVFLDRKSCKKALKVIKFLEKRPGTKVSHRDVEVVIPGAWSLLEALADKDFISMMFGKIYTDAEGLQNGRQWLSNQLKEMRHKDVHYWVDVVIGVATIGSLLLGLFN